MKNILFLNHNQEQCGVYQDGLRHMMAIKNSKKYNFIYEEIGSLGDHNIYTKQHNPVAIIYNYHPATSPFLNQSIFNEQRRNRKIILIYHEGYWADFDYYIHFDPTFIENSRNFRVGRCLFPYHKPVVNPNIPTIGSFGFPTRVKKLDEIVKKVNEEFDEAVIRFRMSKFSGGTNQFYNNLNQYITKPNIKLEICHDFVGTEEVLDFLASNSINVFWYTPRDPNLSVSGAVDYALSVKKPIAVSDSSMFKHINTAIPSIVISPNNSLKTIMNNGFAPLMPYFERWTHENLTKEYETIFDRILE